MENIVINKYKDLVSYFENLIIESNTKELNDLAKSSYIKFAKKLCELENSDIKYYIDRLETLKPNINKESTNPEKESPIQKNNEEKSLEEYIYFNVYRNKDAQIGDEFQKLSTKLREDFKKPNDLLIITWIQNYLAYVNKYKKVLDEENLIKYMRVLFKKYDNTGTYYSNLDKYINEAQNNKNKFTNDNNIKDNNNLNSDKEEQKKSEENKEEGLKIINIKKPNLNKKTKNVLKTLGLIGIGYTFGLPTAAISLVAYGIYKLYKKHDISNEKLNKFLNENHFKINKETDELVDEKNDKITDETIDKEKYSFFKKQLMKLNERKENGFIKKDYKKNKFTSILLKSKLVDSLKNKYNSKKETTVSLTKKNSEELMHKGLGKC